MLARAGICLLLTGAVLSRVKYSIHDICRYIQCAKIWGVWDLLPSHFTWPIWQSRDRWWRESRDPFCLRINNGSRRRKANE